MLQSKYDVTKETGMENWIKEIMQTETRFLPFDQIDKVSFHLQNKYAFSYLELDGRLNLLLESKTDVFSINAILKEIVLFNKIIDIPVIYSCSELSHYQKSLLLRNHIPFIVKGNAISLPFLGMYLSRRMKHQQTKAKERFTPIAQFVFLYLFYSSYSEVSFKQLAFEMKINKMSVSRAINELSESKIVETEAVGRAKKVMIPTSRDAFLKSALPFLQTPVLKVVYAAPSLPINECFITAGTKALSEQSMLNENKHVAALYLSRYLELKKSFVFTADDPDENDETEIEVWKYDPVILAQDGKADLVSLYLSLKDNQDERVKNELDTLWNNKQW